MRAAVALADSLPELLSLLVADYPHDRAMFTLDVIDRQAALRRRTALDTARAWQTVALELLREKNPLLLEKLSAEERAQLHAEKSRPPMLARWDAPIDLVLVESSVARGLEPCVPVGEAVILIEDLDELGLLTSMADGFGWVLVENVEADEC